MLKKHKKANGLSLVMALFLTAGSFIFISIGLFFGLAALLNVSDDGAIQGLVIFGVVPFSIGCALLFVSYKKVRSYYRNKNATPPDSVPDNKTDPADLPFQLSPNTVRFKKSSYSLPKWANVIVLVICGVFYLGVAVALFPIGAVTGLIFFAVPLLIMGTRRLFFGGEMELDIFMDPDTSKVVIGDKEIPFSAISEFGYRKIRRYGFRSYIVANGEKKAFFTPEFEKFDEALGQKLRDQGFTVKSQMGGFFGLEKTNVIL